MRNILKSALLTCACMPVMAMADPSSDLDQATRAGGGDGGTAAERPQPAAVDRSEQQSDASGDHSAEMAPEAQAMAQQPGDESRDAEQQDQVTDTAAADPSPAGGGDGDDRDLGQEA